MSYNPVHHSSGFRISPTPGTMSIEEKLNLLENKRFLAKPSEILLESVKMMTKVRSCLLGPMDNIIGEFPVVRGIGYDLYFNNTVVSGPDAMFYSRRQAIENCSWNKNDKLNIKVSCKFEGINLN